MSRKRAVIEKPASAFTTLQVPLVVKAVLKAIQAADYAEHPEDGVTPMGRFMAAALAEKFPEHAAALRKAGLID